ncbi:MAG: dihydroorotase [Thermoplasmata archaeon]
MSIVYHGNFFIDSEFKDRYIEVEEGKIVSIRTETSETEIHRIDGKILPAGVDIHVHFRDPGEEYKEDFNSGSISSIFGGTTFVADMPNNKRPILNQNDFKEKIRSISGKSYVDFSLYQAGSDEIIEDAIGEKIFLGKSTGGLLTDLKKSLFSDRIKVVHAELQKCLDANSGKDMNLKDHDKVRPVECEYAAIEEIFKSGLKNIHIAHITTLRALTLSNNFGFSTEVTPHHILLNNEMDIGPLGKVNPPLRKKVIQEELLNALNLKELHMISSDHAPHSIDEKKEFENSPSGMPGVETRVPLILFLAKIKFISLERAISLISSNPASRIGLKKGMISQGYDADFISVDFEKERIIAGENMHSKAKWTPFEGFKGIFPNEVYLRGQLVMEDDELISGPSGVFINGKQQRKSNN